MPNPFSGISHEDAAAILPVLEIIRQRALDDQQRMMEMYDQLLRENRFLRNENEVLRDEVDEFRMVKALLGPRPPVLE